MQAHCAERKRRNASKAFPHFQSGISEFLVASVAPMG